MTEFPSLCLTLQEVGKPCIEGRDCAGTVNVKCPRAQAATADE